MIFTYALVQDRKRCSLLEWWSAFAVHRAQLMSLRGFPGKPLNQRISRGKIVQIAANSNPWCRDDATKPPIMHNWIESDSSDLENTQQQFEDLQCSSILSINTIYSVFIQTNFRWSFRMKNVYPWKCWWDERRCVDGVEWTMRIALCGPMTLALLNLES